MVYIVLILAAAVLIAFAFGLLPPFPATPEFLQGVADNTINIISTGIYTISYIVGQHLFFGTMILIFAVMIAEPIYHSVMWILRKVPILGIK